MKVLITKKQKQKLLEFFQISIESIIYELRNESEYFGLGEMSELYEINSIEKIVVDKISTKPNFKVFVTIYVNNDIDDFEIVIPELEDRLSSFGLLDVELVVEKIIKE